MYISNKAIKDVTLHMSQGYDLGLALFRVSSDYALDKDELRRAYDKKLQRQEMISNGLCALGMLALFASPVLFYFVARG